LILRKKRKEKKKHLWASKAKIKKRKTRKKLKKNFILPGHSFYYPFKELSPPSVGYQNGCWVAQ